MKINPKDFNACTNTGIYACGGIEASNGPSIAPYGVLVVFNCNIIEGYSVQMFFDMGTNKNVFYRIGLGVWGAIK